MITATNADSLYVILFMLIGVIVFVIDYFIVKSMIRGRGKFPIACALFLVEMLVFFVYRG